MIHSLSEIRALVAAHNINSGAIGNACRPPLSATTVWRVLSGRSRGKYDVVEAISEALDRLVAPDGSSSSPGASSTTEAARPVAAEA